MSLNPNVSLRPAATADWPAIAALLEKHQLPLDGAQVHLENYVVAVSNGEIVGSAGMEVYGDLALLRSVAVAPGLHKQGVGKLMVGHLIEEAKRCKMKALYLLTVTAPEYFAQHGFKRNRRDEAPAALRASAEFQGACPACAVFMSLPLAQPVQIAVDSELPVAVLGAGPVGLAAVARLIERRIPLVVLEAASQVGANLLDYGHVRLFSPWRYNVDAAMAKQLQASGWQAPPADDLPLAREIVERALQPFARLTGVAEVLQLSTKVVAVTREGFDKVKSAGRDEAPFLVRAVRDGRMVEIRARAVIDATGTWCTPNPLGANGLPAIGEREAAAHVAYGIPDVLGSQRGRYAGKKTLVVGAGHSAANVLLSLAELAKDVLSTRLAWGVRSRVLTRVFGGGEADALPARGQLGSALRNLRDSGGLEFFPGMRITELRQDGERLVVLGFDAAGRQTRVDQVDEIICATGQRLDLSLTSELRVKLDPWLESTEALGPLIDPNVHSCGTVRPHGHRELAHPEAGFYTLGVKSYGRAPTFLMATGFEQARSVVAAIAGDLAAADRVELDLPETGVCGIGTAESNGCCGDAQEEKSAPASTATAAPAAPAATRGCGTAAPQEKAPKPQAPATPSSPAQCCGPAPKQAKATIAAASCCRRGSCAV